MFQNCKKMKRMRMKNQSNTTQKIDTSNIYLISNNNTTISTLNSSIQHNKSIQFNYLFIIPFYQIHINTPYIPFNPLPSTITPSLSQLIQLTLSTIKLIHSPSPIPYLHYSILFKLTTIPYSYFNSISTTSILYIPINTSIYYSLTLTHSIPLSTNINTIIITITQFITLSSNTLIILPTIILIHTTIHTLFFTFTTILNHHLLINHISITSIYLHPISITPSHISIHHHNTLYAITTNTYT